MILSRRSLFTIAGAAVPAVALAQTVQAHRRSTTQTLVCIGDSLTLGAYLPVPTLDPWPYRLQSTLFDWTIVNAGIGGNTVIATPPAGQQTMTARFQTDVLDVPNVKAVIIAGGINDCGQVSATDLATALESLFWQAYNAGLNTYLCTMTPMVPSYPYYSGIEPDRESVNDWMRSYFGTITDGATSGVLDYDATIRQPSVDQLDPLFATETIDGLHFNFAGHVRLADLAKRFFS